MALLFNLVAEPRAMHQLKIAGAFINSFIYHHKYFLAFKDSLL